MKLRTLVAILKEANYYDNIKIGTELPVGEFEVFVGNFEDQKIDEHLLDKEIVKSYIGEDELTVVIKSNEKS